MKSIIIGVVVMICGFYFIGDHSSNVTEYLPRDNAIGAGLIGLGLGIILGRSFGGISNSMSKD